MQSHRLNAVLIFLPRLIPMLTRARVKWDSLSSVAQGAIDMYFTAKLLNKECCIRNLYTWREEQSENIHYQCFMVELMDATFIFSGRSDNDNVVLIDFLYSLEIVERLTNSGVSPAN
jgi:hypothetical protein